MNEPDYSNLRIAITGGTGSFGQTVTRHLLDLGAAEIRIISRDETKQDAMRRELADPRLRYFIGDIRHRDSLFHPFRGVDVIFHAAALKQVPSCEFFPEQAISTNILGSENVILQAAAQSVSKVVFLSTDKAVAPINAMGMTKALMEKLVQAYARRFQGDGPVLCCVRYGNVMYSRGSVVPLFTDRILKGLPLPITAPQMTRFMLPLAEAVDLVKVALVHGLPGDVFVRKSPAATVATLAEALQSLFGTRLPIELLGIRHGEKIHETLATGEELRTADDLGAHLRIPMDCRDINYAGNSFVNALVTEEHNDFTSESTLRLDVVGTKEMLLRIPEIRLALEKR
ncbi:MAG: polysaccharide biosynthesis protein [Sterolibacterium sp.]